MTDTIAAIATAVGALGTLATVSWAIIVYSKNRHETQVSRFRADIVDIVNRFDEMMTVFQDHIVAASRSLFDLEKPESKTVYKEALEVIGSPDEPSFDEAMADYSSKLDEWALYSLDPEVLSQADKPRLACYATMQSIRGFLPVMYEFISKAGDFVFAAYHEELSINTIRKYICTALKILWKAKKEGTATITNESELVVAWRKVVAAHMSQVSNRISFVDVFNEENKVIKKYAELYLRDDNNALWNAHKKEMTTDIKQFGAKTKTGTLINIVKWKLGKRDPDIFTELVQFITRLEERLDT